jgi:hypothetical protein
MPVCRAFVHISIRVPSKETLPHCSPRGAPIERDVPFLENNFIFLSEFKINEPPSFHQTFVYREVLVFRGFFCTLLAAPEKVLLFNQYLNFLSNSPLKKPIPSIK